MGEEDEEKRTLAIASFWVRTPREAQEAKFLAHLNKERFTTLMFRVVDAELARLREVYAAPLVEWRASQDRIAQLMKG
jgi:allantoicase